MAHTHTRPSRGAPKRSGVNHAACGADFSAADVAGSAKWPCNTDTRMHDVDDEVLTTTSVAGGEKMERWIGAKGAGDGGGATNRYQPCFWSEKRGFLDEELEHFGGFHNFVANSNSKVVKFGGNKLDLT